ncbi:MAG: permease [Deltaproteobacteria bacterium]|nr:permease [Deltaproteobacteria bacterium]
MGKMFVPTVVMLLLALALVIFVHFRQPDQLVPSLRNGGILLLQILPILIAAFIVVGLIPAVLPKNAILRWVGEGSGMRGILIGSAAGGLMTGPPYAVFPIIAGIYKQGAGIGAMVAFLTSWSTWQLARLPLVIALFGPKFTIVWVASIIIFIPIAGLVASYLGRI